MRRDTQYSVRWRVIWRDKTQTLQQYIRITVKKVQVKSPASSFVSSTISDNHRQFPKIKRYSTMCARAIPEMYSYF